MTPTEMLERVILSKHVDPFVQNGLAKLVCDISDATFSDGFNPMSAVDLIEQLRYHYADEEIAWMMHWDFLSEESRTQETWPSN